MPAKLKYIFIDKNKKEENRNKRSKVKKNLLFI